MPAAEFQQVDVAMHATITADANSGWACIVVPNPQQQFGTGKAVKIRGTIDGHELEATMLPIGGGEHMVPIKGAVRKAIGKDLGDSVRLQITGRRP